MMRLLLPVPIALIFLAKSVAQPTIRKIRPGDTDPQLSTFTTDSHYVYLDPTVPKRNLLLVHLPGTFGEPKRATLLGITAASLGFHSIGLMYPNVPTVGSFCTNSPQADCFEKVRREIIEGQEYSPEIDIPFAEGILNRIEKVLLYLKNQHPNENWGQFLNADNRLIFEKTVVSGHSQGGGHAALMAALFPLKRAICLSAPKDWRNQSQAPPPWLSRRNPESEVYAFNHVLDEHDRQLVIWDSLGLNAFGPPVGVESMPSPFNQSRQLTTQFPVPAGDDHACTVQDNKTPKIAGQPVFRPVWTYLLTHNLTTARTPIISSTNTVRIRQEGANLVLQSEPGPGIRRIRIVRPEGRLVYGAEWDGWQNPPSVPPLPRGMYWIQVELPEGGFQEKIGLF